MARTPCGAAFCLRLQAPALMFELRRFFLAPKARRRDVLLPISGRGRFWRFANAGHPKPRLTPHVTGALSCAQSNKKTPSEREARTGKIIQCRAYIRSPMTNGAAMIDVAIVKASGALFISR